MQDLMTTARAATPGPWFVRGKPGARRVEGPPEDAGLVVCDVPSDPDLCAQGEADAAYIAAANPQTVLALCELLERAAALIYDHVEYCGLVTEDQREVLSDLRSIGTDPLALWQEMNNGH